jgi:prepilin peptidase CpaA
MDIVLIILQGTAIAVFGAALIYAAISDLRTFEIPNWVSGAVVISFLIMAAFDNDPWPLLQGNVITGVGVFVVGFALYAGGYFGAGDVKLLAAIALWMGWPLLISYIIYMVLAGGVLALALIVFRRFPLYARFAATPWIVQLHARKNELPYAVAIAVTALTFLPRIPIVSDFLSR